MEIREQAALSLWALGGQIKAQQRSVAECIGVPQIITMLLSPSEKLQYVALNAIVALTEEDEHNQKRLYDENILTPLFRLLKQYEQLSHRVLLVLIRVFGVLCIGTVKFRHIFLCRSMFIRSKVWHLYQIRCCKTL